MDLADLYEGSEEMVDYLNIPYEQTCEASDKWDAVIENHLLKIFDSSESLKLPSFIEVGKWVNTLRPLSSEEDLINKVVVIDFFTYCCINCEHILPYLKEVEEDFKDDSSVVMIGVHSPKFPNEKDLRNVTDAVLRNNIVHPVLHDQDNYLWRKLGIYCWPTVLIISPSGVVLFSLVGEHQVRKLNYLVHQALNFIKSRKMVLNTDPLPIEPVTEKMANILRYPSYITCCDECVVVSDTGHNRLVLLSLGGEIMDIVGTGCSGCMDGSYSEASFNNPHGTAWWKPNKVFVADTGNHSIRQIDLMTKRVSTVFAMGKVPEFDCNSSTILSKNVSQEKFSSPWDVCIGPKLASDMQQLDVLYIAVAGAHQIWALYLTDCMISDEQYIAGTCVPFAGNGKEECRNNYYRMKAGFAQPSGITYSESCPGILFIADSESSTIRSLSLINGAVKTVVGGGLNPEDLFQFGDADGKDINVKLQHPLAVCAASNKEIFVADTYNHKIKLVNTESRECQTIINGSCSNANTECTFQEARFLEPSGLCYLCKDNILLVSDTNNHCIKAVNLDFKKIEKMDIHYPPNTCVDGPFLTTSQTSNGSSPRNFTSVKLCPFSNQNLQMEPVEVDLNLDGEIHCYFLIDTKGISLTDSSVQPWNISFRGECDWKVACSGNIFQKDIQPSLTLKCIKNLKPSQSEIELDIDVAACDYVKKTCFCAGGKIKLHITTSNTGCKIFSLELIL